MRLLLPAIVLVICGLAGCPPTEPFDDDGQTAANGANGNTDTADPATVLIFHNNRGPMCLEALEWLETVQAVHPDLRVEEHLTFEDGESELLAQLMAAHDASSGVSTSFQYLPIIFIAEQAFSGFNEEVSEAIEALLGAGDG